MSDKVPQRADAAQAAEFLARFDGVQAPEWETPSDLTRMGMESIARQQRTTIHAGSEPTESDVEAAERAVNAMSYPALLTHEGRCAVVARALAVQRAEIHAGYASIADGKR